MIREWVFIDTAEAGRVRVGFIGKAQSIHSVNARAGALLPEIARRFSSKRLQASAGVVVVAGPGSFSAVRGGVLVANLLARLWRKPLLGILRTDADDLDGLVSRLASGNIPAASYVAPVYDAEPNIIMKKACV